MKKITRLIVAMLLLLSTSAIANATIYMEGFEDPFPTWESGWLGSNSNLTNFYGIGAGRGNNPDGLWIGSNQIAFDPAFGVLITNLSLDVASWVSSPLLAYDMLGHVIFNGTVIPNNGAYTDPGTYQHFTVTSNAGISMFEFSGLGVPGNLSIDNVVVSTGGAPVPEPSTFLLLGAGLAGVGFLRRRAKK